MKRLIRDSQAGQAVIEYILMIVVALSILSVLAFGFRKVLFRVWMQMACSITAPCPHCSPPQELKNIANRIAPGSCR